MEIDGKQLAQMVRNPSCGRALQPFGVRLFIPPTKYSACSFAKIAFVVLVYLDKIRLFILKAFQAMFSFWKWSSMGMVTCSHYLRVGETR